MTNAAANVLDAEHAAFIQGGVSINIATCDAGLKPHVVRAVGCRVSADRRRLTLFFSRAQGQQVLADVAANGRIAAVFSKPSTHRTMQFKGNDARESAPVAGDVECVARYRDSFVQELTPLAFDPAMLRTFLAFPDEEIAAVTFSPQAAFLQTPGPRAGEPLGAAP